MDLEELRRRYERDRYATEATRIEIDDAGKDSAVCSFEIEEVHRNASGGVQGGAIFTLADFAFAVAANQDDTLTVTVSSTIEYIGVPMGKRLIGRAVPDKVGKSLVFYTVFIEDELGNLVAKASTVGKRTHVHLEF